MLFSSASALLGNPGQAVYAGANAALDALAGRATERGTPAVALQWGPWASVGMAQARTGVLAALHRQGS